MVAQRWRLVTIVGLTVATVGVAVIVYRAGAATYTASASFVPQNGGNQLSGLAGLAAQYGVAVPMGGNEESPEFYAQLLRSRRLLGRLADEQYTVRHEGSVRELTLVEYFGRRARSPEIARERAIEALNRSIQVGVVRQTGVVRLAVETRQPELSRQIAERMVRQVEEYNVATRQTNAAAERQFIESRLSDARTELEEAESILQSFLQQNRMFTNSPELQFAHDRLQRQVTMRQQVVSELSQSYERARIEEVRNTPVISIVEEAETPALPNPRGRVVRSALMVLLGMGVGVGAALVAGMLDGARRDNPAAYAEFRNSVEQVKGYFRRRRPALGSSDRATAVPALGGADGSRSEHG